MWRNTVEWLAQKTREADDAGRWILPSSDAERRRLSRLVRDGTLVSPARGVYALASAWSETDPAKRGLQTVRSMAELHPSWTFSHFSAALVYGLEVGFDQAIPLHVTTPKGFHARSSANVVRHPQAPSPWMTVEGVRVTTLEHTVVDCLLELDFGRGLAILDSALRKHRVSKERLRAELLRREACPARGVALDAIAFASPRAENGGESIARAVMIEQGFAIPQLQVEVGSRVDQQSRHRVDFYWDLGNGTIVAGELDGPDKHVDPDMTGGRKAREALMDERLREPKIGSTGMRVMRFSFADVQHPVRLVRMMTEFGIPRGEARHMGRRTGAL